MINFDKIIDEIFVGSCPASSVDVHRLKQAGMSAILNLQTDGDFKINAINWPDLEKNYHDSGIASYRYPIIDFDDDDLIKLISGAAETLNDMVQHHSRVYVHCTAGKQRSPSAVITYLAWHKNLGLQNSIDLVMAARNCAPPIHALERADALRSKTNSVT